MRDPDTTAEPARSGPSARFGRDAPSEPPSVENPRALRYASIEPARPAGRTRPAGHASIEADGAPRYAAVAGHGGAPCGSRLAWWILASLLVHGGLGGLFDGPSASGAAAPLRDLSVTLSPVGRTPAGDAREPEKTARASPAARPAAASAPDERPESALAASASGTSEGPARHTPSLFAPTPSLAVAGQRAEHTHADTDPTAKAGAAPDAVPSPPLAFDGRRAEHTLTDTASTATPPVTPDAEPSPPPAFAGRRAEHALADTDPAAAPPVTPDAEPSPPLAFDGGAAQAPSGRTPAAPATPVAGNPAPRYPRAARRRGIEGRLVLQVLVDARGAAHRVEVFATSGHGLLDEAALAAVRRWRFVPGQRDGRAAPSVVRVPVTFRLDRAS